MKNIYKSYITMLLIAFFILPVVLFAGNKDRSGQAGASELLINPWARSSGWGGVNVANSFGLESMYTNIAGLAHTKKTEIIFSNTQWLGSAKIGINNFGIAQKIGESSVIGISLMAQNFGDIMVTTTDLPDGGRGTFSPKYNNFNLSYAKAFTNAIYGGINIKVISESVSDLSASGIALDAGIQYITGENENIHFGISLKNVGPTMNFSGDGFSFRTLLPGQSSQFTLEQRSADFELPTQLNIGASYAFLIDENHTLTLAGAFNSNAFSNDQYIFGAEYNLKNYFMVRGAYSYEDGINTSGKYTASTGLSAGATVQIPISKENKSAFALDYAYRPTSVFDGSHSVSIRLSF